MAKFQKVRGTDNVLDRVQDNINQGLMDLETRLSAAIDAAVAAIPSGSGFYPIYFVNSRDDGGATRFMTLAATGSPAASLPRASTDWWVPVAAAGTVVSLQLKLSTLCPVDNTAGSVDTWTVRLNGVDTAMFVQVFPAGTLDGGTFAYKISTTGSFAVVLGDVISLKWVHNMPGAVSNLDYPTCVVTVRT